ncbi:MAG: hypothetical protein NT040_16010 [Bacteroidetes bacterium]|nr:hypothetical protein [Bacteroidota bacterium]
MQQETKIAPSLPLRYGVLCNGPVFQRWQADAVRELNRHGHQLVLLIVDDRPVEKSSRFRRILNKKWSTILYTSLENRVFKPGAKSPADLGKELRGIAMLNCTPEQKGYSEYFTDADLAAIRNHHLDFILRFGFNIIRGGILSAARLGVWSFHHDDEMVYRGGPPGFWEIFRGDPVNGAIMQRLTEKLDGGIILQKGYLKTVMHSYRENLDQILSVSSEWPARQADTVSRNIDGVDDMIPQDMPSSRTTAPLYRVPGNLQMLKFLFLLMRNRLKFYYLEFFAAEAWNVGVIRKPIGDVALTNEKLVEADVTWLPEVPRPGYLADPAGFMVGDMLHILAEEYDYALQKAGITEFTWDSNTARAHHPGGAIPPGGMAEGVPHLSYPYVFEHDGTVWCVPESYQSSRITLFRRDTAGGTFVHDRVLLAGVRAVDPTLIFYNGMWWLFFTDREYSNTHLFLYHSKELTGEFKPHRLNPVKIDIRSARPAGTPFIREGVLYRPAQDCSVTYGGRVVLNRVVRLTTDDFAEEPVNYIEPVRGSRYSKALHTISSAGAFTLIDGKRYRLSYSYLLSQVRSKIKRKGPGHV